MISFERALYSPGVIAALGTLSTGAAFACLQPDTFATKAALIIATTGTTLASTYLIQQRKVEVLEPSDLHVFSGRPDLRTVLLRLGGTERENGEILFTKENQSTLFSLISSLAPILLPDLAPNGDMTFSTATQQAWRIRTA